MRAFRSLAVFALVSLSAGSASAQASRHFKDSWFWGVQAGAISYQVMSATSTQIAPMGGLHWLITRTNGGLYVAVDQSFFKQSVFVNDSISPLDTVPRQVDLQDMRRFTLAGMLFPMQTEFLHPYIGFGVALNSIATATPIGTYRNSTQQTLVQGTVARFKTAGAPLVILGAQFKLPLISMFVQSSAQQANDNFFLFTGTNWRVTLETGVRINTGSSIDRMDR
jgi:hypothetical protein